MKEDKVGVLFGVAFVLLAALTSCAQPIVRNDLVPFYDDKGAHFLKGELSDAGGIPFIVISGNYYEMGLQYGVLLKEPLLRAMDDIKRIREGVTAYVPWLARPFVEPFLFAPIRRNFEKRLPQRYRDELRGISDGAGIPYDLLLYAGAGAGTFQIGGCSSALVRTDEGMLHGRNLDWAPGFMGRHPVIARYEPDDGLPYYSFGFLMFPTAMITGMNDEGITVSFDIVWADKPNDLSCLPIYYQLRELLGHSRSLDQAEDYLYDYATDIGWLVAVSSSNEKTGKVYNISSKGTKAVGLKDGYAFALNGFSDPGLQKEIQPLLDATSEINDARSNRWRMLLGAKLPGTAEELFSYCADVGFFEYGSRLGSRTIDNGGTLQTAVMDPAGRKVLLAYGPGYAGAYPGIAIDLATRKVSPYNEKNPNFMEAEKANVWNEDYLYNLITGRAETIVKGIDITDGVAPNEARALFTIWDEGKDKDTADLLFALERCLSEYPESADPGRLIGSVFEKTGRDAEAAEAYQKALKAEHLFPNDIIRLNYRIATLLKKTKRFDEAKGYALVCLDSMYGYVDAWRVGKEENRIIKEMRAVASLK